MPRPLSAVTGHLIETLKAVATGLVGDRVDLWAADGRKRRLWRLDDGKPVSLLSLRFPGPHVILNPSFLLEGSAPLSSLPGPRAILDPGFLLEGSASLSSLLRLTSAKSAALCARKSSRDVYGFAFLGGRFSTEMFWAAICCLTGTVDDDCAGDWEHLRDLPRVAPGSSCEDNSPALSGVEKAWSKRAADSPVFLNTALLEMLRCPLDQRPIGGNPQRMADALLAQRTVSKVPWIFNTLVNEIEYRQGAIEPRSFPPEIHLSLTGACNIECRFCAYAKSSARFQFVDLPRVARLDFLRHVQILRLSSGLGEPTLNKHLPDIVNFLADRYPHIALNFFTNGVALDRPGVIPALVGRVRWINVSLNAATAAAWKEQCQDDLFERVCRNLSSLHEAKRGQGAILPLVFGSMVLNRKNLKDLPRMPALCRRLGVDRFTAFPYSGLGYHTVEHTFGENETLEKCRSDYDALYEETVREAMTHKVSLEIPLPGDQKKIRFGVEVRGFYDFAGIERNEWRLAQLLGLLAFDKPAGEFCNFLWRTASVGSTHKGSQAQEETHFLYPCIGPLSSLDLSGVAPFRFPDEQGFSKLRRNPVFRLLRQGQSQQGLCKVCDSCRQKDSRDPAHFLTFEHLVAEFADQVEMISSNRQPGEIRGTGTEVVY